MKYKANHNLRLPDGKTEIMAGDTFEYEGDISGFADIVEPVIEKAAPAPEIPANDENPKNEEEAPVAKSLEGLSEEEIRKQGKAWKVKNAHNLNIDTLKERIYEAYKAAAPAPENDENPEAPKENEGEGAADAGK